MDLWRIRGGRRLEGECRAQGSKNAALPILAACLLCPGTVELRRVPRLLDVDAALQILRALGCRVQQQGDRVYIDASSISGSAIPRDLMERMRSSVFFMGALLARTGQAALSLPGGCKLGKRPIDLHLMALRELGAEIEEEGEQIFCRASSLKGREIRLPFPSVGATENAMIAACAAKGESRRHCPHFRLSPEKCPLLYASPGSDRLGDALLRLRRLRGRFVAERLRQRAFFYSSLLPKSGRL